MISLRGRNSIPHIYINGVNPKIYWRKVKNNVVINITIITDRIKSLKEGHDDKNVINKNHDDKYYEKGGIWFHPCNDTAGMVFIAE